MLSRKKVTRLPLPRSKFITHSCRFLTQGLREILKWPATMCHFISRSPVASIRTYFRMKDRSYIISTRKKIKLKTEFLSFTSSHEIHTNSIIKLISSNNKIVTCSLDKSVKIFDTNMNDIETEFKLSDTPTSIALSERRGFLVCGMESSFAAVP